MVVNIISPPQNQTVSVNQLHTECRRPARVNQVLTLSDPLITERGKVTHFKSNFQENLRVIDKQKRGFLKVAALNVVIQEKWNHTNIDNSIFICPQLLITIEDNNLAEEVTCVVKGESLLRFLFWRTDIQCRLYINLLIAKVDYKINLILSFVSYAIVHPLNLYNTDIYAIPPVDKLVVQHVFHKMRALLLAEIQTRVPQAKINSIIFLKRIKVFSALDVVSLGGTEQE